MKKVNGEFFFFCKTSFNLIAIATLHTRYTSRIKLKLKLYNGGTNPAASPEKEVFFTLA